MLFEAMRRPASLLVSIAFIRKLATG